MKMFFSGWMLAVALLPMIGSAGEFENLKSRYAATADIPTRARIVEEANAPSVMTETRTITNVAPASVIAKVQQLGRILTNFAAVTSQTGVNYDALKEYALNNAADLTAAQHAILLACDRLWSEVREYAPDGLLNFHAVTTNSVTVQVQGPSPAMQRLGRAATAEDLK